MDDRSNFIVDNMLERLRRGGYVDLLDLFLVTSSIFIAKDEVTDEINNDTIIKLENLVREFKQRNAEKGHYNISRACLFVLLRCSTIKDLRYSDIFNALADAFSGDMGNSEDISEKMMVECESLRKEAEELEDKGIIDDDVEWASEGAQNLLFRLANSPEGAHIMSCDECGGAFLNVVSMRDVIGMSEEDIMNHIIGEANFRDTGIRMMEASYEEVENNLYNVITEEQIEELAKEIVRRSISQDEETKTLILYGSCIEVHGYLACRAMDYIGQMYPGFKYDGKIEYNYIGEGRSRRENVHSSGNYGVTVCVMDTSNVNYIKQALKMRRTDGQTTIVESDVKDVKGNPFGAAGYRVSLTREQLKKYIQNSKCRYLSDMRFGIELDARIELNKLVDEGKTIDEIWAVQERASAESIFYGNENNEITAEDVKAAVKDMTKHGSDETVLVRELRNKLGIGVKGQDEALDAITRAVKIAKAGLNEEDKPIASFMFVGPTGTGKTETAKQLAKALDREFIRIDMGDYKDQTAVNKFNGASAGYVGYEDGSVIGKAMKGKEHCVLLFDEIEKAHSSVYDVMMHMLDNGEIKDNKGKSINFRDAIIIMTSNAGAREVEKRAIGFGGKEAASERNERGLSDCVQGELELSFKPEFINRFDAIIQYNKLDFEVSKEITEKLIKELEERAKLRICLTDAALLELASKGTDIRFGAREIKRVIDRQIKAKLAEVIIDEGLDSLDTIYVDFNGEEYSIKLSENDSMCKSNQN